MASRKKKSKNQIAYEKELKRIKAFVRRAEKRGFRFEKSVIPEKPNRYTKKAVMDLKELTSYKLYKKATYLSESGAIVSGYAGRTLERKAAAGKRKKRQPQAVFPVPSATNVILDNVKSLIGRYPTAGSLYLNRLLDFEIRKYGKDAVAKSLAKAPEDAISLTKDIVYYIQRGSDASRALKMFAELITGNIPSEEELKELGDVIEAAEDGTDYED